MRRRAFLASSVPLLAGLTGCGSDTGSQGPSPEPGTRDEFPTKTRPPADADSPSGSDAALAPDPASDLFADVGCPSFDDSADRTVCYHEVDPSTADVVLGIAPELFDPDDEDGVVETLTITLYNRSDWHFHFNPHGWGIERLDDGEWVHVAPEAIHPLLSVLPPGETHAWEIPSEPHPTPFDERYTVLDVALAAGVYAFHVAGSFGGGLRTPGTPTATPTAEPPEERIECVGLFQLDDDVDPDSPGGTPREAETGTPGDR